MAKTDILFIRLHLKKINKEANIYLRKSKSSFFKKMKFII